MGADSQEHCERCGTCCRGASPTLQQEDLHLLTDGVIRTQDLYTIRRGELVRDNIHYEMKITPLEMLKVRERPDGSGCVLYDDPQHACAVYEQRPAQCAAFACWDLDVFMETFTLPKLARSDVIRDGAAQRLLAEHERRCGYDRLNEQVRRIRHEGERAVESVLEALNYDHHLRILAAEKLGFAPCEMGFFFGRPLSETIIMFGLQVTRQPDGSYLLTVRQEGETEGRRDGGTEGRRRKRAEGRGAEEEQKERFTKKGRLAPSLSI